MRTLKTIVNIILGFGCMAIFNDSASFMPNFFGLACFVLLIVINAPDSLINKLQK